MTKGLRIAVVGATGAVGAELAAVLRERRFRAAEYRLFASAHSAGKTIDWVEGPERVEALSPRALEGVDLAFFSAGASISREYGPVAVSLGATVIDNSSAFRMDPSVPLVVPEVNPQDIRAHRGLIANPNCSTIILVVPLAPLHRAAHVQRVVVSTYQAASGAGARAVAELQTQTREVLHGETPHPQVFHVPCAFNVFSHNSAVGADGFNGEESKVVDETRKILGLPALRVAPTCMRVPVLRAHTESVSIELRDPLDEADARDLLRATPGVRVVDDREKNLFPMPIDASGGDDILVGRIRQDPTIADKRGLQFVCCGDQLRKGAALNAVQIAELL